MMVTLLMVFNIFVFVSAASLKDELDQLENTLDKANSIKEYSNPLIDGLQSPISKTDDFKQMMDALDNAHSTKEISRPSVNDLRLDELIDELKSKLQTLSRDEMKRFRTNTLLQDASNDDCMDQRTDCESLKSYCESHKSKLETSCKKTCGFCDKCVDKYNVCNKLAASGQCELQKVKMRDACPKSCNFCKAPAPAKCSSTTFGCCFDKQTVMLTADGKNCPVCKDEYKYVCNTFASDCENFGVSGDFMRRQCPQTCGICENTGCVDHPNSKFYCPLWKKDLNWCAEKKDTMKYFCPKTCGYC